MVLIKDPEWYYKDQNNLDKIYSNIIFIILGIYHYYRKNYILSFLFTLLFLGSSTFHLYTNKTTLLLDRLAMILIFSKLFNSFTATVTIFEPFIFSFFWLNEREVTNKATNK